jgi:glycosyltransferase involved in cell wall biosynthesis
MRVLLVAEQCNPAMSSTPYFGYRMADAIAGDIDECVLATQIRNKTELERRETNFNHIEYFDTEWVASPFDSVSKLLRGSNDRMLQFNVAMRYPSNIAFEYQVYQYYKKDLKAGAFDIVHRVTPLSPTLPAPLAKWSPVPTVVGPINGGLPWPPAFWEEQKRERELLTWGRSAYKWLPYWRSGMRAASAILSGFEHTTNQLPVSARRHALTFPDVGCDPPGETSDDARDRMESVTVLFAGRLVPYKCPDLVIQAFADSHELREHHLVLVGDGFERRRLEELVRSSALENNVTFTGWLPHDEVQRWMGQADIFAFPSIRELGAGVVVEAMSAGLVPVVADYGGPGYYIDSTRGRKIPITHKDRMADALKRAIAELAADAGLRRVLQSNGREYVKAHMTWPAKAGHTREVYRWVLGERADKPAFDFASPEDKSGAKPLASSPEVVA